MRTDCFKCYTRLERTPVREVKLEGAHVAVVHVTCPCCGRDYGEDYDVQAVTSDPALRRDRRLAQQHASKQRYFQKLRAAFRASLK